MLINDQDERVTMAQVIDHPYLTKNGAEPIETLDVIEEEEISEDFARTDS